MCGAGIHDRDYKQRAWLEVYYNSPHEGKKSMKTGVKYQET